MNARGGRPVHAGWTRAVTRARAACAWLVLSTLLLAGPLLTPAGAQEVAAPPLEPGQVVATAVHPFVAEGPRTVDDQVPLVEVFTATWCPPCAPADRALDRLLDERSPALAAGNGGNGTDNGTSDGIDDGTGIALAVLQYHPVPDPDGEDPFGVPEGMARMTRKYDAFWFPSVYVQGIMEDAPETRSRNVDAGMEQLAYESYGRLIDRASGIAQPLAVTTASQVVGRNVTVDVEVRAGATVAGTLYLQAALWQDHVFFRGSNGVDTHRMTVLGMADRRIDADGLEAGEVWTTSWTMALPAGMDPEFSGVTVFVETAWDVREADEKEALMGMAVGTAGAAATMILFLRRRDRTRRMEKDPGAGP